MDVAVVHDGDEVIVRNVKRCGCCGGTVDRHCQDAPDPHVVYVTKFFQCRGCGALGDPVTGIMEQLRRSDR